MSKYLIACVWTLMVTGVAQAAPTIQLRTSADPKEITIGDRVTFSITVQFSTGITPLPIDPKIDLGSFELLDYLALNPKKLTESSQSQTTKFILTTFSTGTHTIPSVPLTFQVAGEGIQQGETPGIDIIVKSVIEDYDPNSGLKPLKPFYNFRSYFWLWLTLTILIFAGLIFALIRWIRIKRGLKPKPGPPPRPPEEIIWDEINALEDSDLLENGEIKEFYSRLSTAIRAYLEDRAHIPALDRTTAELLREFKQRKLEPELLTLLKSFFEFGDLVKFAKFVPTSEEALNDLDKVKKIISHFTPRPEPKKEEVVKL